MNYIITGTTYNGKYVDSHEAGMRVLSCEELAQSDLRFSETDKVYVPSETSLSTVMQHMDNPSCVAGINKLKDKYLCREALRSLYPDFYFAKCKLDEISQADILERKIVIKPLKGFFGTGVRFADSSTNLDALKAEIRKEVTENSRFFPESILTKDEYIIEEFIEGEEYAVDMFYDELGKAVITNIYHHPVSEIPDYAHLMYYSNKELFDNYLETFIRFFNEFGASLKLRNFPIHAEFKLRGTEFVPIEFNPMRYGGFGLADLTFNSYGYQPIAAYFNNQAPNWEAIWISRQTYSYAFILAYNGKGIDLNSHAPEHERFRKYLKQYAELMDYVKLDFRKNPVFAIAYIRSDDYTQMLQLLSTEFADYFAVQV
ncbi:MAG: ATP-grasp domain-containing protein [Candidatus Cloacimonetes bacterium]|nr:ATP-grasp domain-containing protein [Candidatus Cloacimonadota bacterium]